MLKNQSAIVTQVLAPLLSWAALGVGPIRPLFIRRRPRFCLFLLFFLRGLLLRLGLGLAFLQRHQH